MSIKEPAGQTFGSGNVRTGRLLTIQDLSCIGKCSLTVALPVISAMGVETAVLPTALLSAHTMFHDVVYLDLTDQMRPITNHWKREGFTFDTIYTGYLGSVRQMDLVREIFRMFGENHPLIVIDPVMADYGRLYSGFDDAYVRKNAVFCGLADVILPNLTEAAFMTGLPYREAGSYDRSYILDMLDALCALGPRWAVLTGVSFEEGKTGVIAKSRDTGEIIEYFTDRVPAGYHGTGDLFSSVVSGALTRGFSLRDALRLAADYTRDTIETTFRSGKKDAWGVDFEKTLPELIRRIEGMPEAQTM